MAYNSMYTQALVSREWSSFAYSARSLRVSRPKVRSQHSSDFLFILLRYAISYTAFSVGMHWLASASFFYTRIFRRGDWGVS
jgi:hypothetical protein